MADSINMQGITFKKAPVCEVALLVQFDPISELANADLFRLWSDTELRKLYPSIREYAELPPSFESFGEPPPSIEMVKRPYVFRFNYRNDDKAEQFQVQRNRAGFYWQRGSNDYPRFPYAVETFWRDFDVLAEFFKGNGFGAVRPNQCAVSYSNRLVKGKDWEKPEDLAEVVTFISNRTSKPPDASLLRLDDLAALRAYSIRNERGLPVARLYATLSEVVAPDIDLELSVRGAPGTPDRSGIQNFFQMAHDNIVDMFKCVTTPKMHELWELQ
jgi:uncharacterized protein (TIGR04255 family)